MPYTITTRAPFAFPALPAVFLDTFLTMIRNDKELIVVGDRVLVKVEEGEERTKVGLYLPATAIDSLAVQTGLIVNTGPGDPLCSWRRSEPRQRLHRECEKVSV